MLSIGCVLAVYIIEDPQEVLYDQHQEKNLVNFSARVAPLCVVCGLHASFSHTGNIQ